MSKTTHQYSYKILISCKFAKEIESGDVFNRNNIDYDCFNKIIDT